MDKLAYQLGRVLSKKSNPYLKEMGGGALLGAGLGVGGGSLGFSRVLLLGRYVRKDR